MSNAPASTAIPFSPLNLQSRSLAWQLAAVALGTLLLTASSYVTVPMYPVPVTMQTFAILVIGALYGWRLGTLTVLAWLGEAAIGLPVLAGGAGGLAHFVGPTGGYIASWPLMTVLVGGLAERGWNGNRPVLAFLSMLAAGTLCLGMGAIWLAGFVGLEKALALGATPFLLGDALKAALGAVTLRVLAQTKRDAA
jgi:biotin transport system substrate-specific component